MAPPVIRVPLPQLGFIQDSFSLARFSGNRLLLLLSAVSACLSLLRCPSCRCRNSSTLARPFSDRMGEKTLVTVRPSRLRLWNVPITFELLTFPRSVQCPQSPSVSPTSPRVTPLPISRAAIGCDGRCCCLHRCLWSGNRLCRNCYVVSIAVEEGREGEGERAALDWSPPPIRICGPSSLFGAGDDLGRSVVVGPKVADAGRSHRRQ